MRDGIKNTVNNRKIQWVITIVVGFIVLIGSIILLFGQFIGPQLQRLPFMSNRTIENFHERYQRDPEIPSLIFEGTWLQHGHGPFIEDEIIYLPANFFKNQFDQFLFWDESAEALILTTQYDILTFYPDQVRFYINGANRQLQHPIRLIDDEVFLPESLAEALYPVTISHIKTYNMIVVEDIYTHKTVAHLTSRTNIRYMSSRNSPIATRAASGSVVTIFDESEDGNFTRVRSEDGLLGWVLTSSIGEREDIIPREDLERPTLLDGFVNNNVHQLLPNRQPIVIAWDFLETIEANDTLMEIELHESINVLSPMWLVLTDEGITSMASNDYVEWARAYGVEVWANVYDMPGVFMRDRDFRMRTIDQLVHYVDELDLKGLNIGFEYITSEDWPHLVQFLRELAIKLRAREVVLSKNLPVPCPNTSFIPRAKLAHTVDFIVIMAYEEHWQGSLYSGPIASEPFVRQAIEDSLDFIPSDRLILGLPFYNRIWREIIGNNTPETRTYRHHGTTYTREWFEYNGAEWEWLLDVGKYYGEFAALEGTETVLYRAWLECERSIEIKLQMYREFVLAGVAVWNRNFRHNEGPWESISRSFSQ